MIIVILQFLPIETPCLFCTNYDTTSQIAHAPLYDIYPPFLSLTSHTELGHMLPLYLPILPPPSLSLALSPPSLMSCMNVGVRVHVWPSAKLLHTAPQTLWVWNNPPPSCPPPHPCQPPCEAPRGIWTQKHTHAQAYICFHAHSLEEKALRLTRGESWWMLVILVRVVARRMSGAKEVL